MLEKPDLADKKIIACLQAAYGLRVENIAFLPARGGFEHGGVSRFDEGWKGLLCQT